jgi:hypothetical protein
MESQWSETDSGINDLLVAKVVMGWQEHLCAGTSLDAVEEPGTWECSICGFRAGYEVPVENHRAHPPRYGEDMNAAMEVLKRMYSPEWNERTMLFINYLDGEDECIDRNAHAHEPFFSLANIVHLTPTRICVAALKAHGIKVSLLDGDGPGGNNG